MGTTITNKYNLPEVFYRACKVDRHKVIGDISTTQLIDAPQIRHLKKFNDLESDVTERLDMLMGTALHKVLELAEMDSHEAQILLQAVDILDYHGLEKGVAFLQKVIKEKYPEGVNEDILTEQTMSIEIDGMTISGTADRILPKEGKIQDYKSTSVWVYKYPENIKKWEKQLNIYAYMAEKILGVTIDKLEVIAYFKDYAKKEAYKPDYPNNRVEILEIQRYSNERIEKYIKGRVALHQAADNGKVKECTPTEKWSNETTYAVKKDKKNARALFKSPQREECEKWVKLNGHRYLGKDQIVIETIKGMSRRCELFCPVREFCAQKRREDLEKVEKEVVIKK